MGKKNIGLDRLCILYEKLDDSDKEKVIRMTEGLLNSQKVIKDGKRKIKVKKSENRA